MTYEIKKEETDHKVTFPFEFETIWPIVESAFAEP